MLHCGLRIYPCFLCSVERPEMPGQNPLPATVKELRRLLAQLLRRIHQAQSHLDHTAMLTTQIRRLLDSLNHKH